MSQTATPFGDAEQRMDIRAEQRIADLAAELPGAARVFSRHRLDYSCAGQQTLGAACEALGLSLASLAAELAREATAQADDASGWSDRTLDELMAHIVTTYHAPLRAALPELVSTAEHVARMHNGTPELAKLARVLLSLSDELLLHMHKEEAVLFPWIRSGQGATAHGPVRVMLMEHQDAALALTQLRELTGHHTAPANACPTWRGLYQRLADLDGDLRRHIHLENNILFPRTLGGELAHGG
jgi:regulator of cell morphogenesis and NO signaling